MHRSLPFPYAPSLPHGAAMRLRTLRAASGDVLAALLDRAASGACAAGRPAGRSGWRLVPAIGSPGANRAGYVGTLRTAGSILIVKLSLAVDTVRGQRKKR